MRKINVSKIFFITAFIFSAPIVGCEKKLKNDKEKEIIMDNSYLAKQNILIDSIRIAMELVSGESSLEKAQNSGLFERIDRVSPKQKGRPEIILLRNKNILTISMDRDIEKNELYAANVILNKTAIHSIIFNECNILSSLDLHYRGVKKNKQKIRGRHRG